jgi:hypothetical protein
MSDYDTAEHEKKADAARAAQMHRDRVANFRARQKVDRAPADLAARLRSEKPTPPAELVQAREDVRVLTEKLTELRTVASAIAREIREHSELSDNRHLPSPPSLRKLEAAEAAVEAVDSDRRVAKARRDHLIAVFERDQLKPHAKATLTQVLAALHDTVSALGEAVAAIGDEKITTAFKMLALDVGAPVPQPLEGGDPDLEAAHGRAVVVRDALNEVMLLARSAGGIMWSERAAGLVAARMLVDQIAGLRRARGDAS